MKLTPTQESLVDVLKQQDGLTRHVFSEPGDYIYNNKVTYFLNQTEKINASTVRALLKKGVLVWDEAKQMIVLNL